MPIQTQKISRLTDHFSQSPQIYLLSSVFNEIRTGKTTLAGIHERVGGNSLAHITAYARQVLDDDKSAAAYGGIKSGMPAVCFGGTLDRYRQIVDPTCLVLLDYDDVDDMPWLIAEVVQIPQTFAAFTSLSGKGLKVLVLADPVPSKDDYKFAWFAAQEHYSHLAEADASGNHQNKLCALVHDPRLYLNSDAVPLTWERDDLAYFESFPHQTEFAETGEWLKVPTEHKEAITNLEFNAKGWSTTALPCIYTEHEHDNWYARSNGMYVRKNADGWTFKCFKCKSSKRYYLRTTRRQVKLKDVQRFAGTIDTLDAAREQLKDVFNGKRQFFAIRTDTGTGKTENALTYAATCDVLMPVQNSNLRDEIVERAIGDAHGLFAFGYRGLKTPSEDGYLGCIQADRADAFRAKGFNMYSRICPTCPANIECQDHGYLSQKDHANKSQLVVMPFPTIFLNPGLRTFADTYMPRGENALVIHDDLPIGAMFVECQLTTNRLEYIMREWQDTPAAEWAYDVLGSIGRRDWNRLAQDVDYLNDTKRAWVIAALTHAAYRFDRPIDADEFLEMGLGDYTTAEACKHLPQIEEEDWNALIQLEFFFEHYKRPEDMPMAVHNVPNSDDQVLTWYIPPIPYKAKKTLRLGFMSATFNKQVVDKVLPDAEFIDASATEFHPGARVYQLRTNKNPRGTVLNSDKNDGMQVLSRTGEFYYESLLESINAHPREQHAVITYKAVLAEKKTELETLGVVTAHFGNLVGLDKRFKDVSRFHVLFSPEVSPVDVSFLAKMVFGDDETPLNDNRDGNGEYVDERLQLCVDSLVISELKQIVGRARLNLYPNTVFLWTSRFVDGISNRAETKLFDEADWRSSACGDTELLDKVITEREAEVKNAKTEAEANEISSRHAYRKNQEANRAKKDAADRDLFEKARILKEKGMSNRKIGEELGVYYKRVERILKKLGQN